MFDPANLMNELITVFAEYIAEGELNNRIVADTLKGLSDNQLIQTYMSMAGQIASEKIPLLRGAAVLNLLAICLEISHRGLVNDEYTVDVVDVTPAGEASNIEDFFK